MKLHHLHLEAIGPFARTVDVDFAALGASGMFLLEGPTGSGKSTILDAIVFALYGHVASESASSARIRSQFAGPERRSVVDLIFETGSGIYRVSRTPEYQRPKKRGTGTTKEQASAQLWRLGSPDQIQAAIAGETPGEYLASRSDEVGREVARAVGLTREQFTQTVLLPQNEFARFLRAGSKDRQEVLQRVFGTELFADLEARFERMRREAKNQVDAARGDLGRAVARFAEAAGSPDQELVGLDEHASELELEAIHATARERVATLREHEDGCEVLVGRARARTEQANIRERTAQETVRRVERRRELAALAARLGEHAADAQSAEKDLARDRLATPILALLKRRDRAASQAEMAAAELEELLDQVPPAGADLRDLVPETGIEVGDQPDPGNVLEQLADIATQANSRAGELTDLVRLEVDLPERDRTITRRTAELETSRKTLEALTEKIGLLPEQRTALQDQHRAAQKEAATSADARVAQQGATARRDAAAEVQTIASRIEKLAQTVQGDQKAAASAIEHERDLRARRIAGMAGELAAELEDGEACPVCGALEHPAPARTGADHVDAEQVEAAEIARQGAEKKLGQSSGKLSLATAEQAAARERSGGLDLEAATEALEAADARVRAAETAQQEVKDLDARLAQHQEQVEKLGREREQAELQVRTEDASLAESAQALAEDRVRVTAAREDAASVAERRRAHLDRARIAGGLREALQTRERARMQLAEATTEATEALEVAPDLESAADVRAAVLTPGRRTRHEDLLRARAADSTRLEDGMAEPDIAETPHSDEALAEARTTLAGATTVADAERSALRSTESRRDRARDVLARAVEARSALRRTTRSVRTVADHAGVVVRVADLATGGSKDGERIPLSTFVLMRRFEDVIDAANVRLAQFAGSDLELLRDTGARGAKKTGLDLLVMDRRTDATRVPETLSGGETFFVSLALALGLADIVTAEAGGVQLDTLFIDEGFGSLDAETLETVVREIGRLAEHGRTIGMVSHVGEMQSQIAEQIHVRRGSDRTSTVTVTA
jgi:exonuclease SbcC